MIEVADLLLLTPKIDGEDGKPTDAKHSQGATQTGEHETYIVRPLSSLKQIKKQMAKVLILSPP